MHSTSTGPPLSQRGRELPRMRWPLPRLQQLQQLRVVFASVLLLAGEQRQRVQHQRKAEMVASRFVRGVHTCRGAGTHADPRSRRKASDLPDLRDVFLCHAWDDRQGAAKELHDLLESRGVRVWFSEKDVALGTPLLREIDRGLAKSRVGIVLVTPALLRRLQGEASPTKSYRHS